jgi:hypothetical protein
MTFVAPWKPRRNKEPVDERRRDQRIVYRKIVQVTLLKVPGKVELTGDTYVCDASDISLHGMCLHIEAEPTVQSTLRLKIMRPPPQKSFLMVGHVRWVHPNDSATWDIGVLFDENDARNSPEWLAFIANLSANPAPGSP